MNVTAGLARYVFIANLATSAVWLIRYAVNDGREASPSFDLIRRGDVKRYRDDGSSLDQQAFSQRYATCNHRLSRIAPILHTLSLHARSNELRRHLLLKCKSGRARVSHLALA